jgi:hypothetical protein
MVGVNKLVRASCFREWLRGPSALLAALLFMGHPCPSAPAETSDTPAKPAIKQIAPGILEIAGRIRLNQRERSLTIPASVNMREGAIEYLLVTSTGKTHESILRTDVEPYHVHVAMLLLGAKGRGTNAFPEDASRAVPGDAIRIEVSWLSGDKRQRMRAEDLVFNRKTKKTMKHSDWAYNGSEIGAEGFAAQQTGSIVSLITDSEALVNNPLPLRADDDNWTPATNNVPVVAAPVDLVITLVRAQKSNGDAGRR